jgi:hypothetical protein
MSGPLSFPEDDEQRSRPAEPATAEQPPPSAPPRTSRYGWIIAVAFLVWLAYITINTLRTDSPGSRGLPGGEPLPPFAAPLATSNLRGDANVATKRDQGRAGKRPACSVRGPEILNSCELAEKGPVVLAFYASRAGKACARQLDAFELARRRFPGVQFAALAIRGDRTELRRRIRDSGWGFPIGHDEDGVVSNLYGVAGCPTTTLAYPGGIVMRSYVGPLQGGKLAGALRRLETGARRRGWQQ